MKRGEMKKGLLVALAAVVLTTAACAAPTPVVVEKEITVEKPVVEIVEVEKEVVVEAPVIQTVVVEKEVVIEKPSAPATPTLLPAPEPVGAFPSSIFATTMLIISPNPKGAEGTIEFPPQQSGNNWVIFQVSGIEGEYHLNVEFTDLGAINEWGGEVKFPLAVCVDCPENRGENFSFEGVTLLREILQEQGLDEWPWGEWYLDTGCFVVSQPQETIKLYYRVGGTPPECPGCELREEDWCVSTSETLCEEPEELRSFPPGHRGSGETYVSHWGVHPSGKYWYLIPGYESEWDFYANAQGHIPTCRWPVGTKEDGEILWVGEPEYIECIMRAK